MSEHDDTVDFLESLESTAERDRLRTYQRFCSADQGLPFPLAHLLRGVHKQRENPAAFVDCLTWFFETSFRFLLATVLDPLTRRTPLVDEDWPLLDALLDLSGETREVSMGGWRDLYFQCIRRAINHPESRAELPGVLSRLFDRPAHLAQLDRLFSTFVAFRNRLEHGRRDGNLADFMAKEQDLYERGLMLFLRELESLTHYDLFLRSASDGTFLPIDGTGHEGFLVDHTAPDTLRLSLGQGVTDEVFLGEWGGQKERLRGAWSLHPYMVVDRGGSGALRACLFRRFVPVAPNPRVLYDRTMGERDATLEVKEPALIALLQRIVDILQRRRSSVRRGKPRLSGIETRLAEEQARVQREEDQTHLAWLQAKREEKARQRSVHRNRVKYPRDPHFKGRAAEMAQILSGLGQGRSMQIRSYIQGLGGVGKTAMAVELCYRAIDADTFADGVLWYRVCEEPIEDAIAEMGAAIDLGPEIVSIPDPPSRIAAFRGAIRSLDLLVVLDNADFGLDLMQPLFDVFEGLPLLVTSRRELDLHGALTIHLEGLAPSEAYDLVRTCLGSRHSDRPDAWQAYGSEQDVQALCSELAHHPLALKLSSFHVLQNRLTLREYLSLWREHRLEVLEAAVADVEPQHRNVRACFDLSFQTLSPNARRLLALMSMWDGREFAFDHLVRLGWDMGWRDAAQELCHEGPVRVWMRIPNSPWVVTGGQDGRALLWVEDEDGGARPHATIAHLAEPVVSLAIDRGRRLTLEDARGDCVVVRLAEGGTVSWLGAWAGSGRAWRLGVRSEAHWRVPVGDQEFLVDVLDGYLRPLQRPRPPRARTKPEWIAHHEPWSPDPTPSVSDYRALLPVLRPASRRGFPALLRSTGREDLVALADELDAAPTDATPRRQTNSSQRRAETALRQLVMREILAASLATEQMTPDGLRLRLHALVSEFAGAHLEQALRTERRSAQTRLYLDLLERAPEHLAQEEANVLAAIEDHLGGLGDEALSKLGLYDGWLGRLYESGKWHQSAAIVQRAADAAARGGDTHVHCQRLGDLASIQERLGQDAQAWRTLQALESKIGEARRLAPLGEVPDYLWVQASYTVNRGLILPALDERRFLTRRFWWLDQRRYSAEWQARRLAGTSLSTTRFISEIIEPWQDLTDPETLFYWADHADELPDEESAEFLWHYLRTARARHNIASQAHAVSLLIERALTLGEAAGLTDLLVTYEQLAELRDVDWAHLYAKIYRALHGVLLGELSSARLTLKAAEALHPRGTERPFDGSLAAAIVCLDDDRPHDARRLLTDSRGGWAYVMGDSRALWHLAVALLANQEGDPDTARHHLARHLAYRPDYEDWVSVPLGLEQRTAKLKETLQLADEQTAAAATALWGLQGRPRQRVIEPRYLKNPSGRRGGPDLLVAPCHLRPRPVLVAELRSWARSTGTPLPWYYAHHRPDAADDEPARFLCFATATALAAWLQESLPQSYGWPGLPADRAWGVQPSPPPSADHHQQLLRDLRAWAQADQGAWFTLQRVLAAPLSAVDKYRLCHKVQSDGARGLPDWVETCLAGLACPSDLESARHQLGQVEHDRLQRDLRSVAHLCGLCEPEPTGLWLRPAELTHPETRYDLHTFGAVGRLDPAVAAGAQMLVPGALAWADVLVWPGTLHNLSHLAEEAPPCPWT